MLKKVLLLSFLFILLFTLKGMAVNEGDIIPDFELTDLQGERVKISDYRGDFVLYDVWATWCGPCLDALNSYIENYDKFKDAGIKIIAISVDMDIKTVKKFVEDKKLPFTVLHAKTTDTSSKWGVRGIPTMFFVNPEGKVLIKEVGFRGFKHLWDKIATQIDSAGFEDNAPILKPGVYNLNYVSINDFNIFSDDLKVLFQIKPDEFTEKPQQKILKEPEYQNKPLYGSIRAFDKVFALVAVDTDNNGFMDILYVDANNNLDLTDDHPIKYFEYNAFSRIEFTLDVFYENQSVPCYIGAFSANGTHAYYSVAGIGYEGKIESLDGEIRVILADANGNKKFSEDTDIVFIDLNKSGTYDSYTYYREFSYLHTVYQLGTVKYAFSFDEEKKTLKVTEIK